MTPRSGRWQEHPCRQDCPQRRAGCHAVCRDYKDYEADKRRRYDAEERARQAHALNAAAERWGVAEQKKRKKGDRKYGQGK